MNFEREGYTFVWKIENLSCAWQRVGKKIESPIFTLDDIKTTRWRLVLYPKGQNIGNYISLYLKRLEGSKGPKRIAIDYEFSFLTGDGEILKPNFVSNDTFKKGQAKGASQFKMRDEMFYSKCVPEDILTAYCRIWINGRKNMSRVKIFAITIINVDKASFVWDIENFSKMKISQRNAYAIKSAHGDRMVTLELFLTGDGCNELININARSYNKNIKFMRFNSFLLDATGNRFNSGMQEFRVKDLLAGKKLTLLVSKKELIEKKNIYLPKDVLSLNCECDFSTKIAFEGVERIEHGISSPKFRKEARAENVLSTPSVPLTDALKSMFLEGLFCDTELRTPTQTFSAHKNILSARSPIFKEMFRKDIEEKTGYINITDVEGDTIHRMLLYMYTDTLEDLKWETAPALYLAADKYQILSLKSKCSAFLISNLTVNNAYEVLILADMHQDKDLKNAVQDYILQNEKAVFCSSEWQHLMDTHAKLAAETMCLKYYKN
ncbi:speckle-type POZ protein B [Trichonephila inaurata madagascariensis]|uniref:Speckle-type POZ protein B n=1 Tax=Trichonephila inaurata madagascariensis TaxID=2747483 RepID=A0A8X6XW53_9ARAC|nr:speckle-type POZ protein B [Trichonephila inaurata madagascariensis]